jgi:hypothetical protein
MEEIQKKNRFQSTRNKRHCIRRGLGWAIMQSKRLFLHSRSLNKEERHIPHTIEHCQIFFSTCPPQPLEWQPCFEQFQRGTVMNNPPRKTGVGCQTGLMPKIKQTWSRFLGRHKDSRQQKRFLYFPKVNHISITELPLENVRVTMGERLLTSPVLPYKFVRWGW